MLTEEVFTALKLVIEELGILRLIVVSDSHSFIAATRSSGGERLVAVTYYKVGIRCIHFGKNVVAIGHRRMAVGRAATSVANSVVRENARFQFRKCQNQARKCQIFSSSEPNFVWPRPNVLQIFTAHAAVQN